MIEHLFDICLLFGTQKLNKSLGLCALCVLLSDLILPKELFGASIFLKEFFLYAFGFFNNIFLGYLQDSLIMRKILMKIKLHYYKVQHLDFKTFSNIFLIVLIAVTD